MVGSLGVIYIYKLNDLNSKNGTQLCDLLPAKPLEGRPFPPGDRWLLLSLALVLAWRHFQRPHLRSALLAGEALVAEKRKKSSKEAAKKEMRIDHESDYSLHHFLRTSLRAPINPSCRPERWSVFRVYHSIPFVGPSRL